MHVKSQPSPKKRTAGRSATHNKTLNTKKHHNDNTIIKSLKRKFTTMTNLPQTLHTHSPPLTSTRRSIHQNVGNNENTTNHSNSSLKNQTNDFPILSSLNSPSQLAHHFRDLALAANSPESFHQLNQQFDYLRSNPTMLKTFPKIPSVVYSAILEANLANNNFSRASQIVHDTFSQQVKLPPNSLINTFRKLSLNGQIGHLEETMRLLIGDIERKNNSNNNTKTNPANKKHHTNNESNNTPPDPFHDNQPINLSSSTLIDSHTATQLKESLVLGYVNKAQLQSSVNALVRNFGPGSGSIPSDNVLETIVQNLLRYRRPRHAHQLATKFDVYCTPKVKSKLYSKIALSFLESNMTEQLNQTLAYMEQNDISPHPSMMESLLAHIIQTSNPNVALKWYNQIYPNTPQNFAQIEQQHSTSLNTTSTLPEDQNSFAANKGGVNLKAANTIIKSLFSVNHHHQALEFLQSLPIHTSTLNIVLKAHYESRDWDSFRLTLKYMLLRGLPLDQHGLQILIQSLAFHTHPAALTVLLDTLTLKQNLRLHPMTYNFFIRSLKTQGYPKLCEQVLARMKALGETPDQSSYNLVIHAYLEQNMVRDAYRLKDAMSAAGIQPNLATYSIIFDSLIRSGDALALYHALTEVFDRAEILIGADQHNNWTGTNAEGDGDDDGSVNGDDKGKSKEMPALSTHIDFNSLHQTFPKTKEMLKQTQNDPSFTEKQRLLTYLRSYIKAACHLLSTNGYKRYAETLSTFYLSQGGAAVNQKLATLPFNRRYNSSNRFGKGAIPASQLAMNPDQAYYQENGSVNPSLFLQGSEAFGTLENDGVGEVLSSLSRGNQENEFLVDKMTLKGSDNRVKHVNHRNLDPFNQQQHDMRQHELDNDPDLIYERLNSTFGNDKGDNNDNGENGDSIADDLKQQMVQNKANMTPIGFTVEQSDDIINQVLRSHHFGPQSRMNHNNNGTSNDDNNPKMFDVRRLHALPANSLNDYIDRADTAMMQLQQDRVIRCQYQGLVGRFDSKNQALYFNQVDRATVSPSTIKGVKQNDKDNNGDNSSHSIDDNLSSTSSSNTRTSASSTPPTPTVGKTINYGWGKGAVESSTGSAYLSSYKAPTIGHMGENFDRDKISPYSTNVTNLMKERESSVGSDVSSGSGSSNNNNTTAANNSDNDINNPNSFANLALSTPQDEDTIPTTVTGGGYNSNNNNNNNNFKGKNNNYRANNNYNNNNNNNYNNNNYNNNKFSKQNQRMYSTILGTNMSECHFM